MNRPSGPWCRTGFSFAYRNPAAQASLELPFRFKAVLRIRLGLERFLAALPAGEPARRIGLVPGGLIYARAGRARILLQLRLWKTAVFLLLLLLGLMLLNAREAGASGRVDCWHVRPGENRCRFIEQRSLLPLFPRVQREFVFDQVETWAWGGRMAFKTMPWQLDHAPLYLGTPEQVLALAEEIQTFSRKPNSPPVHYRYDQRSGFNLAGDALLLGALLFLLLSAAPGLAVYRPGRGMTVYPWRIFPRRPIRAPVGPGWELVTLAEESPGPGQRQPPGRGLLAGWMAGWLAGGVVMSLYMLAAYSLHRRLDAFVVYLLAGPVFGFAVWGVQRWSLRRVLRPAVWWAFVYTYLYLLVLKEVVVPGLFRRLDLLSVPFGMLILVGVLSAHFRRPWLAAPLVLLPAYWSMAEPASMIFTRYLEPVLDQSLFSAYPTSLLIWTLAQSLLFGLVSGLVLIWLMQEEQPEGQSLPGLRSWLVWTASLGVGALLLLIIRIVKEWISGSAVPPAAPLPSLAWMLFCCLVFALGVWGFQRSFLAPPLRPGVGEGLAWLVLGVGIFASLPLLDQQNVYWWDAMIFIYPLARWMALSRRLPRAGHALWAELLAYAPAAVQLRFQALALFSRSYNVPQYGYTLSISPSGRYEITLLAFVLIYALGSGMLMLFLERRAAAGWSTA